jgi:hypothetical protein
MKIDVIEIKMVRRTMGLVISVKVSYLVSSKAPSSSDYSYDGY